MCAALQKTQDSRFHLKVFFNSEILIINRGYSRRWKLSRESKIIVFFISSYRPPCSYSIRVGDHNRQLNEGTEETVQGKEIISHPEYNKPSLINNDIALIRLVRPVKLGQRVGTVCLPAQGESVPVSATCYITGMKTIRTWRSSATLICHIIECWNMSSHQWKLKHND